MHETGGHHNHHSLPANFHLSPSHHPTPSHSPTLSSRPFSPALCSSTDTPLACYVAQRQICRAPTQRERVVPEAPQVPLCAISPTSASPGAVGGHFNSTTKIKSIPLPTLFLPHQNSHRGVRSVRLHANRYLPPSQGYHRSTISDSFLHLPSLDNRPKTRLIAQERTLERVREFKSRSGVLPHRVEQPFFMSGRRARIVGREEVPVGELEEMKTVRFAENASLFYGRGLEQLVCSRGARGPRDAVRRFELRLNTALEEDGPHCRVGDLERFTHSGTTGAIETNDSCKQTFLTEAKTRPDV